MKNQHKVRQQVEPKKSLKIVRKIKNLTKTRYTDNLLDKIKSK